MLEEYSRVHPRRTTLWPPLLPNATVMDESTPPVAGLKLNGYMFSKSRTYDQSSNTAHSSARSTGLYSPMKPTFAVAGMKGCKPTRYQCDHCSYSNKHRSFVQVHSLKMHKGSSKAVTPYTRVLEKRKINGEMKGDAKSKKVYSCAICDHTVSDSSFLGKHYITHSETSHGYKCIMKLCRYHTTSGKLLLHHMKKEHKDYHKLKKRDLKNTFFSKGPMRHKCDVCSYSASRPSMVIMHRQCKHPESKENLDSIPEDSVLSSSLSTPSSAGGNQVELIFTERP